MIWELVKKDITFLVASLKSTLVSIILLALCLPLTGIGFGIAIPALVCYIGLYGILAYEERNKMHLLNLSLPVTRKEICLSKYIYAIGLVVFTMILSCIGSVFGVMATGKEELSAFISGLPLYMTLMFTIAIIYLSVIIPCVFYWGTIKARYVLLGLYMIIFVAASNINIMRMGTIGESLNRYLSGNGMLLLMVVTMICFFISISISLRIWEKKDIQ